MDGTIGARDLYDAPKPEFAYWVDPILIRGGSMLMGGPTKIGKSYMLIDAADSLAAGEPLWGHFAVPKPARVLYMDRELGRWGFQDRLHKRRPPHPNWIVAPRTMSFNPNTEEGLRDLVLLVDSEGIDVIIIDPAGRFLEDDVSGHDVARFIGQLDKLQSRFPNLAYILGHHSSQEPKNSVHRAGWDPLNIENFRGSTRWYGSVDTALMLAKEPKKNQLSYGSLWALKGRWAVRHCTPLSDMRFEFDEQYRVKMKIPAPPDVLAALLRK